MKKRSLFFKVPAALAFAYVCITNIQTVLANKGCLSITDLESMTSANAACENIPSKNNGDCVDVFHNTVACRQGNNNNVTNNISHFF